MEPPATGLGKGLGRAAESDSKAEAAAGPRRPPVSVAAVLPAGGSGERMGGGTPKQFCPLLGRPLVSYTVQAMERITWISDIVVVVSRENVEIMKSIIKKYGHKRTTVVEGGITRHRSIFSGLDIFVKSNHSSLHLQKPEVVIIHDAVRPFVGEDILFNVVMAAKEHGAAGAIRPLVSTVIASSADGCLDHSLDRAKYRASEMPQAFLFDIIYQAYRQDAPHCAKIHNSQTSGNYRLSSKCSEYDLDYGTECLHLALKYSKTNAKLIEGPPELWKVTYKRDLCAADSLIKDTMSQQVCIISNIKEDDMQVRSLLHETLKDHVKVVKSTSISVSENDNHLQNIILEQCYNFVCINDKLCDFRETHQLVKILESANASVLYSVVVISVYLDIVENAIFSSAMQSLTKLAKEVKKKNILLYGVIMHYRKDSLKLQETIGLAASLITALIRDRNPVFVGQMLVA